MIVKVYSLKTCPHCVEVKRFLKKNNIQFEDIDLGQNERKAEEIIKRTGQNNVPVTEVDGKLIVGFNTEALKKTLNINRSNL